MMDKKEILESGLLERYLIGEVSETEQLQVERYLQDSEIRKHYGQLEADFERMAMENAVSPPPQVKEGLMDKVGSKTPQQPPINANRSALKSYLAIAAALALLFGISSFWMYTKLNGVEDQLELVRSQNDILSDELEDLTKNYDDVINTYEITSNPKTEKLIMLGNQNSPQATAVTYVNHTDKTVFIDAEGLPKLSEEHDYQLWADVEGEMIDMGVIAKGENFLAMNYIDHAESYNITIEPAGGSDHPTVERLITNVYLQ
ncbi:anti-sigma factor [Aureisphaera galaxeae]|uniref:anti-sigma factor n=1 Tax=Aureisphaera galaxeae TaxID=1538023 RepID=UPI0023505403|nr:anti-sigma factor [Aureisphaera galaxeae]MDC8004949.1 anti-sigma factor [Aureisphaera galaxeae]